MHLDGCVCLSFLAWSFAEYCKPNVFLSEYPSGVFMDHEGVGDYLKGNSCQWVILPNGSFDSIYLGILAIPSFLFCCVTEVGIEGQVEQS